MHDRVRLQKGPPPLIQNSDRSSDYVHPSFPTSIDGYTAVQNAPITWNTPTRARTHHDRSISTPIATAINTAIDTTIDKVKTQWHCVPSHSMIVQSAEIIPEVDTKGLIEWTALIERIAPQTKPHRNPNQTAALTIAFTNDHEDRHRPQTAAISDCPSTLRLPINERPTKQRHVVILGISR